MVTSRSNELTGYTAGASIFSGRPDPIWPVDESIVKELLTLWDRMEPYAGPIPSPPGLGYRGCFLRDSGHEWRAYRGVVTLTENDKSEARRDAGRQFELRLVRSAPAGTIPSQIVDAEFSN
jgi:hypothetical protein